MGWTHWMLKGLDDVAQYSRKKRDFVNVENSER